METGSLRVRDVVASTARVPATAAPTGSVPVRRTALPDAVEDRLYFAQVREDPLLELSFVEPRPSGSYMVVTSGGCTALSLLARGAGRVVAVDVNAAQNHLLELKLQAIRGLDSTSVLSFLGAVPAAEPRLELYRSLRGALTPRAAAYWDQRTEAIEAGVLGAGVTERFVRRFARLLRWGVLGPATLRDVFDASTLEDQERFYRERWNSWRWRLLVKLLLSRRSLGRTYDPAFFDEVEEPDFARNFRARIEHTLTALPVRDNYFLRFMLEGAYPTDSTASLPPYLQPDGMETIRRGTGDVEVIDGGCATYLASCAPRTFDGFAVSNIAEWLKEEEIHDLFREIVRTATPRARLCFRNFVGWTEVPRAWRRRVREDRVLGTALMRTDRSVVQRRFAPCHVVPGFATRVDDTVEVRAARPDDDADLRRLASACAMRGDVEICVEREPSFFALTRLEGDTSEVAVTADETGAPVGCITAAERSVFLNGRPARIAHVGDLKVHPSKRDHHRADALSRWAAHWTWHRLGPNGVVIATVLAGNRAMERRLSGTERRPTLTRVGSVRTYSVPVFARPGLGGSMDVRSATPHDIDAMCAVWGRVAPARQFAPRLDRDDLERWLARAPNLAIDDYLLARDRSGALVGFLALWDQTAFKQLRVRRYSRRMSAFRACFNAAAPLLRARRLPPAGSLMRCMSAVHVCVPPGRPDVLRALLVAAHDRAREAGAAFFNVGIDATEALTAAFRGFLAQTTDIRVYVSGAAGRYTGLSLDGRPLHYEIALV